MSRKDIEDMPIKITYSNQKIDKKRLYGIFFEIIDREINKECEKSSKDDEK